MATISTKNIAEAIYLSGDAKKSAAFLKKRQLLGRAEAILEKLANIEDEKNGIIRAQITSATKLSDNRKTELQSFIKAKYNAGRVILEENVEPSILGGVRIQVADEVIDLTHKNKINNLKQALTK